MSGYVVVPATPPSRLIPWLVAIALAALILSVWLTVRPEPPAFRVACDAQGGVTVRTMDGMVCLWSGAVLQVKP